MPELQVAYSVPVEVIVDTDTGKVSRVVTVDEQVDIDLDAADQPLVHDRDYNVITDADLIDKAVEIAKSEDWPAWDHGF
jgi:hypothetical protein